ncbi:phosphoenolpyruvate--protein phosphotransferase [Herbaspirillum autotrophicum]|uniref:phosphoenolpyruvate--protein phosphotransferase n=1 Tax=Herbaspirillum autotrophicum TaxID=180195 RepID=UPI00067B3C08|nr:phosphoenolpyruvate--protein phosphotransferase [Herbaspirillum autotrophicum]
MSNILIRAELVWLNCCSPDRDSAIRDAGQLLVQAGCIEPAYIDSLLRRETLANTFLGHGVAIPHGMPEDRHLIRQTGIAVLQIPDGLEWHPGQTTHLIFVIAARSDEHLLLLRQLTRLLQDAARLQQLFETGDVQELIAAMAEAEPVKLVSGGGMTITSDLSEHFEWTTDYPNGLHARPATQWVKTARQFAARIQIRRGDETADPKNLISLLQLGLAYGDVVTISADGHDAIEALIRFNKVIIDLSAKEQAEAALAAHKKKDDASPLRWMPAGDPQVISGLSASPGIAIGKVHVLHPKKFCIPDRPILLRDAGDQLDAALDAARSALELLAINTTGKLGAAQADIFIAQAALLDDIDLITQTCELLVAGHGVAWSWHHASEQLANQLAALGNPLLAARAADLRDVARRVLQHIDPRLHVPSLTDLPEADCILIATDLSPSDTATLDTSRVIGLATAHGGPSAHTAILARTLGLPAIVAGGATLLDIPNGTSVILDGQTGCLYVQPDSADIDSARKWMALQQQRKVRETAERNLPAQTRDGHTTEIAANINLPEQVRDALHWGAEGVGLMRTEFLFLERDHAPDEEEQYRTYRGMLEALNDRPLIVRTLDIGGDKQVGHLNLPQESNPFLGLRGARLQLRRPDLLEPQLRALYRAAKCSQQLAIMFPMITSVHEVAALRTCCERIRRELEAPHVPLGIMVEVPAAAVLADKLAEHVDFFSIGTNDLTQYVLAIDRQHTELAGEADSLHPAVLRLIRDTVNGASKHRRRVGVCGGLAGDAFGAALLVGLGVSELSMSPRDIPGVKSRLRRSTHSALTALAQQALNCETADQVRALDGAAS